MSKFIATFGWLTVLSFAALPQQSQEIAGVVRDKSQAVIPGASVTAYGQASFTQVATRSDSQGHYKISNLPPGDYLVEATTANLSLTANVHLALAEHRVLDLVLDVNQLASRVTVTASTTPQSTDELTKAIDVIDDSQMQQRAVPSLIEALRQTPGLRVSERGGPGSLATIQTRGLRIQDTAILIDGFRFRDASSINGDASPYISDLLISDANRIEVLRGAGSSLYGTNAIGGVVNIVTEEGAGPTHGDITLEGGGLGELRGVARLSGSFGPRWQYSAGFAHRDILSGVDGDDRARNASGQGSVRYHLSPKTILGARVLGNDGFLQLNTNPDAVPNLPPGTQIVAIPLSPTQGNATFVPALDDPDARRDSHFVSALLYLQQQFTPNLGLRAAYQTVSSSRDNIDGPAGPGPYQPLFRTASLYDSRLDTVQLRSDWAATHWLSVSGGFEWEHELYRNHSRDANPDPTQRVDALTSVTQDSAAVYLQNQMHVLNDRLQILLSGRYQAFSLDAPQFSGGEPIYTGLHFASPAAAYTGDASAAYLFASVNGKLRAHVGNGYRVPSLYERFGNYFYGGAFTALGDPRLRPDRSIAMDAGWDEYALHNRLRVSATYFYTKLQEVIGYDDGSIVNPATDPFGRYGGYFNTGGGLARGVETSVEAKPSSGFTLAGSYTYTDSRDRTSEFGNGDLRAPRIYRNTFTASATKQLGRHWDAGFDFLGASSSLFPFAGRTFIFPGPRTANLVAGYTAHLSEHHTMRLYTRINNLGNQEFFEDGFRTPGIWAVAGMKWGF